MTKPELVLDAKGIEIAVSSGPSIVEGVDLQLKAGEILCLVGESGSGKTTTATALLGYNAPGTRIVGGTLSINGQPIKMDESMRRLRGSTISYVPQNPGRSLNPSMRVQRTIQDILRAHRKPSGVNVAISVLDLVGLNASPAFATRYPHQLSGGQQQRVCIASALACNPTVIVLDEPTTGLDVVTQARILSELLRLRDEEGAAMVYVTHDLAVASQIADRIAVMYAGRVVEEGPADLVLRQPRHPYTRGLLASIPDHVRPRVLEPMPGMAAGVSERPKGCTFAPRCPLRVEDCVKEVPRLQSIGAGRAVRCLRWQQTPTVESRPMDVRSRARESSTVLEIHGLEARHESHGQSVIAAQGVSFSVGRGECVALVGESGSGKTTILRTIAGLHPIAGGQIRLHGDDLPSLARRRSLLQRRRLQLVSQNPTDALNPRQTAREAIERPVRQLRKLRGAEMSAEVDQLLEQVRLPRRLGARFPSELSGGERQRVAIARALAAIPEVLLCDEITSALDVSVQAAVLDLLSNLRDELGLGILFITHDLGVVSSIADETLVLQNGRICERGPTREILATPEHKYTQALVSAAPTTRH